MFLMSFINYQKLLDAVHWMYIASIASLLTVTIFGQKYLGARRWIKMPGGGHFQPSEWVKLILILAVAKYFADLHQRELSWPDFIKAGAIVGVPMLLVLAQPDLGTALTYIPIAVMGLFLGGVRLKQALTVVVLAGLMMPLAFHVLKPYQRDRLTSFMQPEADSQGSGYQVIQSLIAVGSGGLWGSSGWLSDSPGVFTCPANRLYLRGFCRGAWICGRAHRNAVILYRADAVDPERTNGARPRRDVRSDGGGGCA